MQYEDPASVVASTADVISNQHSHQVQLAPAQAAGGMKTCTM